MDKLEMVCRTCLKKTSTFRNIFAVKEKVYKTKLNEMISSVTGVKISKNDGLPETICAKCMENASAAFYFKKQTIDSDISLKQKFGDANVKAEVSIDGLSIKIENLSDDIKYDDYFDGRDSDDEPIASFVRASSLLNDCKEVKKYENLKEDFDKVKDETPLLEDPALKKLFLNNGLKIKKVQKKIGEKGPATPVKKNAQSYLSNFCGVCKTPFPNITQFEEHLISHSDVKLHCCNSCNRGYLNCQYLLDHLESCNKENGYNTAQCEEEEEEDKKPEKNFTVFDLGELLLLRPKDMIKGFLRVCQTCSRLFFDYKQFLEHFDGTKCNESVTIRTIKAEYKCSLCSKAYKNEKSLQKHSETCDTSSNVYDCPVCKSKFAFETVLNKHIIKYHKGVDVSTDFLIGSKLTDVEGGKFDCTTCKSSFPNKVLLAKHCVEHRPSKPKQFQCDVCNKNFNRKYNLLSHMRVHDPNKSSQQKPGRFICLYCGRMFSNSSNLVVHTRRHTGEKPYKCDICGYGFPRSSDLTTHRRTHTGEKPCRCLVCGKAFSRSTKLTRHMRVHTGHKPYLCSHCGRGFAQSNDLTVHVRRHTGERPFACDVCGERFIQATTLRSHKKLVGHLTGVKIETPQKSKCLLLLSKKQLEDVPFKAPLPKPLVS